jgi:HEAT repeat protein
MPRSALLLLAAAIALLGSVPALEAQVSAGRLATVAETLQQHGIGMDRASLLAALTNSEPQVRGLAAAGLAEKRDKSSVPSILAALKIEERSEVKADMALAAARLGSAAGVADLRATCDAQAASADLRLLAARYVQDFLEDDHCRHVVEDLTASAPESEDRVRALDLLTGSASTTSSDMRRIKAIFIGALADKHVGVRLVAADHLAHIGSKADAPVLERAIAAEQNPDVRDSMETDLNLLRER